MDQWMVASISFALSQVALGLALLPGLRPWGQPQWFYGAFLVAIAMYLMDPFFSGAHADFVFASLTVLVPGMFFLFSASLFDDHFALRPWHFALVGVTVLLPFLGRILILAGIEAWDALFFELPQLLEFALLLLALYVAAKFWQPDLVIQRRRLRLWFSGFTGLYIFLLILLREAFVAPDSRLWSLQFLPPCGILLATNILLLRYRSSVWKVVDAPPAERPVEATLGEAQSARRRVDAEADPRILAELQKLMAAHVYREMGLTIADLARRSDIPTYRLRDAINRGLGYRNFNDFLNSYRIDEAAARLRDPLQRETQILVIALEVGFRSLSTFNKAFRAAFDLTPTDYRRLHQSS